MAYDWNKIEQEQQLLTARKLRSLGISWLAIGVIGGLIALMTGHPDKLIGLPVWFGIGWCFYFGTRKHIRV